MTSIRVKDIIQPLHLQSEFISAPPPPIRVHQPLHHQSEFIPAYFSPLTLEEVAADQRPSPGQA